MDLGWEVRYFYETWRAYLTLAGWKNCYPWEQLQPDIQKAWREAVLIVLERNGEVRQAEEIRARTESVPAKRADELKKWNDDLQKELHGYVTRRQRDERTIDELRDEVERLRQIAYPPRRGVQTNVRGFEKVVHFPLNYENVFRRMCDFGSEEHISTECSDLEFAAKSAINDPHATMDVVPGPGTMWMHERARQKKHGKTA